MGICLCKDKPPEQEDEYAPTNRVPIQFRNNQHHLLKFYEAEFVENLVLEMLGMMALFVDNEEESPLTLVKLHIIADKEDGWIQVVTAMVKVIPLNNPFGPSAITILLDDCALPFKETVIKMCELFDLSAERINNSEWNVRVERNICIVLGCIAEKLAGPNSVAVLTKNTLDYLLNFLLIDTDACVILFALIALEKFANTMENKLVIKDRIERGSKNPFLLLEQFADSNDYMWRQVGFCAKWVLDNVFIVESRKLSYETVDMSGINAILNDRDVSVYLKISCDGLEARCDSHSFESVRCTFEVNDGCWYYESTIITPGIMQIGWATKHSHFLNHDGYGIGDDLYSISYDGCRKFVWHKARPSCFPEVPAWKPGDVLGCLIDMSKNEIIFSLNGRKITTSTEIFDTIRHGFFAAASFMAFQQCRFNFGHQPFRFPPVDRTFSKFNEHGQLSDEQKKVVPRRMYILQQQNGSIKEDCCTLCCDESACCVLEPCGHRGFCSVCTSQLTECPMCRARIINIKKEDT